MAQRDTSPPVSGSGSAVEQEELLRNLPDLETERLVLRKLHIEDAEDMLEYGCDPEIARMGLWMPLTSLAESRADIEQALEGYRQGTLIDWAVWHKADRKMIGRCGLHPYFARDARADVGYALNSQYWGRGYMTEALEKVLEFGFGSLRLNRVQAVVLPDNKGSRRVLEKAGLQHEALLRGYMQVGGKYLDLDMYAVLRGDYGSG